MSNRLEKRRIKTMKYLQYMIEDNNNVKISQCQRIFDLIKEQYEKLNNIKQNQLNLIYNGRTN
jgi:hypothetical protein